VWKLENIKRENSIAVVKIFAFYIAMVIGIYLLPGKLPYETVRENGIIEIFSAGGHFLFCFFLVYFNVVGAINTRFAPAVFVFLLGLRELDFHARFTTMGMFKIKFFLSPDVPFGEKAIVISGILALGIYAVFYFRQSLPIFKKALVNGSPWAVSVICGIACGVISKFLLDGNSGMIQALLPMLESPRVLSMIMEECIELFIPVFFIRALLQYGWEKARERVPR
jgi:hypothetical protein